MYCLFLQPPFTSQHATIRDAKTSSTPRQQASPVVTAVTPSKAPAPPAHSHISPVHKMPATADFLPVPAASTAAFSTPAATTREMSSPGPVTNGLFRPGFSAAPFHPQHRRSPVAAHQQNS